MLTGGLRLGLYEVCKGLVCDVRCGLCWSGVAVLREGPSPLCEAFPQKSFFTAPLSTRLRDDIIMNGLIFGLRNNARSNICEKLPHFHCWQTIFILQTASGTRKESTFWCTTLEGDFSDKDLFDAAELSVGIGWPYCTGIGDQGTVTNPDAK